MAAKKKNIFGNILKVVDKITETAGEVGDVVREIEALKKSIRGLKGKVVTPAKIAVLIGQVDAIVRGIESIRK